MTLDSPKRFPTMSAFPQKLSSILVSVGGLALFLMIASRLLLSHPIGSTVSGYFYRVDSSMESDSPVTWNNQTTIESDMQVPTSVASPTAPNVSETESRIQETPFPKVSPDLRKEGGNSNLHGSHIVNGVDSAIFHSLNGSASAHNDSRENSKDDGYSNTVNAPSSSVNSGCDLYHGTWYYDASGPLYTNNTCPVLTQMQNCQGNGRPDKEYEKYRWKPSQCDLPRFDANKFLELMEGKTLAFIGDSVARNQMESMLCILWQVEVPKNRGNKRMQRWYFESKRVAIVRIWSSWLVHQSSEPFDFAPEGVTKLHLDSPDETFMQYISTFDVVVLSSGHWFAKQSVYILNNEIVGGQLWWPENPHREQKVNNIEAFGISVETIISSIATHPIYTGIAIVRSWSPDHYEGGAWNTGGSCTGKERPAKDGELAEYEFTNIMHEKQVTGFNLGIKKQTNKAKLRLMDITEAFGYRHDGHPGPYRNPDPNKITKRGPDGRPPPQDCLHWCMPGPIDTWNELVFEIIRTEYQKKIKSS